MNASTETLWHYTDGTSSFGPFSTSVIQQLITTGVIAPGFHLRRDWEESWTPLASVILDSAPKAVLPPIVSPPSGAPSQTKGNPFQRYYLDVLKKYAVFAGRASRKQFWMFNLFSFLIMTVLSLLEGKGFGQLFSLYATALVFPPFFVWQTAMCLFLGGADGLMRAYQIGNMGMLYGFAVFLPSVALGARRINDSAHNSWWLFCPLAPLIFSLVRGTRGPNRHGPDPRTVEL